MGRDDNPDVTEVGDQLQGTDPQVTELQTLKQERDDLYERLLRKQAEFENYKKRVEREKSEFVQFGSAELMKELLNSLDSFELALRNAKTDEQTLRGFELIHKQLLLIQEII